MKILIFGKGFIGTRMANVWPDAVLSDARIDDKAAVLAELDAHRPDAVLNAAGKTGRPNVDWCETHQIETNRGNIVAPLMLAETCAERGVYLLHLASGCVFFGASPEPAGWNEYDFANPESFYSRSKYATDLVLSRMPNVGIARLRMPIDHTPSMRNLIDKLAGYKQIIDVENSVTIIEDLIAVCYELMRVRAQGIFHVTNPGTMRHRDLMALYREYVDPNHTNEWIGADELLKRGLGTAARSNCILQSKRLAELGITMRPTDVALRDTMARYAVAKRADYRSPTSEKFQIQMKGIILAGGMGTRLAPLTNITNKHLLPIYNKPMVLYPLQTLLNAGIRDILVITGPEHAQHFVKLLGSGAAYGCNITYRMQDTSGGIAHALSLAENFVHGERCAVVLGDNIFEDDFSPHINSFVAGAMAFYKPVEKANAYGVVEVDPSGRVLSIEEKPAVPRSNFAQVGLYLFDSSVFDIIKTLKVSGRGELEITDVNNAYLRENKLIAKPVSGRWWDAGSFDGMADAAQYFMRKKTR